MLTNAQSAGRAVRVVLAHSSLAPIKARFSIKTIALATAIACALALVIAAPGLVAGAAAAEPESGQPSPPSAIRLQTYEGMITDTQCGAKHSAAIGKTAAACTLVCVRGGERFVLVDGDSIYLLEGDLVVLKRVAGQRVRISGTLNGKKISVTSVVTT
jgi:uncharacterized low-complexity protein